MDDLWCFVVKNVKKWLKVVESGFFILKFVMRRK